MYSDHILKKYIKKKNLIVSFLTLKTKTWARYTHTFWLGGLQTGVRSTLCLTHARLLNTHKPRAPGKTQQSQEFSISALHQSLRVQLAAEWKT